MFLRETTHEDLQGPHESPRREEDVKAQLNGEEEPAQQCTYIRSKGHGAMRSPQH